MSDEETKLDSTNVAHQLGLLTGTLREFHAGISARIDDIRADVRSLEAAQRRGLENVETRLTARIDGLETSIGRRVDGLEFRVVKLEEEDKNFLKANTKAGGISGGVVGALVSGGIELVKLIGSRGL